MPTTPASEPKAVIPTGASRDIGHGTVKRFSSVGWRVTHLLASSVSGGRPWEMDPRITSRSIGRRPRHRPSHRDNQANETMMQQLAGRGSRLNALMNNAAISPT
jgi:NAD(P)-dependent dehydrogenase (short-subunit alcohol dehydrogenase family)